MATKSSVKQRRRSRRRAALVLVPTVAGIFIAGTAFAYWSTSGVGTATASTGTSTSVTVTQEGTVPSDLAPGSGTKPINFTINNPKTSPQRIASVTIAITDVVIPGTSTTVAGCAPGNFALVQPTAINQTLPPGNTTFDPSGASIELRETGVNQDPCKNVEVKLSFSAA